MNSSRADIFKFGDSTEPACNADLREENPELKIPQSNIDISDTPNMEIDEDSDGHKGTVKGKEEEEDEERMLTFAELLRNHGSNLFSSKSYEGAVDAFTKALDNAPATWNARLTVMSNKAAALYMLNRYVHV